MLKHRSGIHKIEQVPLCVHQPMAPASAAGTGGSGAIGIGLVVLLLIALPAAKLVLPLDDDAGHEVLDRLTETSVRGADMTGGSLVRMTLNTATAQRRDRVDCLDDQVRSLRPRTAQEANAGSDPLRVIRMQDRR